MLLLPPFALFIKSDSWFVHDQSALFPSAWESLV